MDALSDRRAAGPGAWTLFPLDVLLALLRARRLATLAAAMFLVAFVTHTLLAWKAERYFSYALPFFAFFGRSGGGGSGSCDSAAHCGGCSQACFRAYASLRWGIAIIGFLRLTNHDFVRSNWLMLRDHGFLYPAGAMRRSRGPSPPIFEPHIEAADVLVSTEDLRAIAVSGKLDYVLGCDHLRQGSPKPELTEDPRNRAKMIGENASLARVATCHGRGVLVPRGGPSTRPR